MPESTSRAASQRGRAQAGFSLIETLIAAAILLLILIGILPLFERSRMNLIQGYDASRVSNATIENSERLLSLPFNSFLTNVVDDAGGAALMTQRTDFWLLEGDTWADTVPASDRAQFTRTTTIQQYSVGDATDDDLFIFETPRDSTTQANQIHMKRILTDVVNPRLDGPAATYRIVAVHTY